MGVGGGLHCSLGSRRREGKEKTEGEGQSRRERPAPPPTSLPFLAFAAFLTLVAGASAATWVRREKRQRSTQGPQSSMLLLLLLLLPAVGLGQRALAAGARAACLKAAATRTSVQKTLPKSAAGVPKKKKKKILQKEEGLGAAEPGCCSGNTHPASWPRPLKQSLFSRILKNTCLSSELTSAGQFSGRRWVTLFPGLTEASHQQCEAGAGISSFYS